MFAIVNICYKFRYNYVPSVLANTLFSVKLRLNHSLCQYITFTGFTLRFLFKSHIGWNGFLCRDHWCFFLLPSVFFVFFFYDLHHTTVSSFWCHCTCCNDSNGYFFCVFLAILIRSEFVIRELFWKRVVQISPITNRWRLSDGCIISTCHTSAKCLWNLLKAKLSTNVND